MLVSLWFVKGKQNNNGVKSFLKKPQCFNLVWMFNNSKNFYKHLVKIYIPRKRMLFQKQFKPIVKTLLVYGSSQKRLPPTIYYRPNILASVRLWNYCIFLIFLVIFNLLWPFSTNLLFFPHTPLLMKGFENPSHERKINFLQTCLSIFFPKNNQFLIQTRSKVLRS